jgi:hypothetical protein
MCLNVDDLLGTGWEHNSAGCTSELEKSSCVNFPEETSACNAAEAQIHVSYYEKLEFGDVQRSHFTWSIERRSRL